MALECLETLVGLAQDAPGCFSDPEPDGFDTSDSGYYILDSEAGLNIIESCELEGWTLLERARTKGILQLKTDLGAALRTRYGSAVSPFSGKVGKLESTGTVSASFDRAGLRLRVKRMVKGGKIVLKKAFIGVNTTGTYPLSVTSNDPLFTGPTPVNVSATANQFGSGTALGLIELPMWSDSCPDDYLEYFISFDLDGALPLNNTLGCGCGKSSNAWSEHLDASGFNSDSDTPTSGTFSTKAYGLVLDLYLSCGELDWICELTESGGDYALQVTARTLQFAQQVAAIDELINSGKINICTSYNQEEMNSRRNYLAKAYANNVQWLAANVPPGATGCFACKPAKAFHKTAQLV